MSDEWIEVQPIRGRIGRPTGQDVTGAWRTAGGLKGHRLMLSLGMRLLGDLGWKQGDHLVMTRNLAQGKLRLTPGEMERGFSLTMKKASGIMSLRLDEVTGLDTLPAEALPFERQGSTLTLTLPDWAAPGRVVVHHEEEEVRPRAEPQRVAPAPPPPPPPVERPSLADRLEAEFQRNELKIAKPRPLPATDLAAEFSKGTVKPPKIVPIEPGDEADDLEAMEMMRKGKTLRAVMDWFGWHEERDRRRLVDLRMRLQAEDKPAVSAARR